MKIQCRLFLAPALAAILPILSTVSPALAQPGPPSHEPTLRVHATQPLAYEPGSHPGEFTIRRGDATNAAQTVAITLSGTATNGVDYETVPTTLTLAAGQSETNILITPLPEAGATRYKTVQLNLPRGKDHDFDYGGARGQAVVYIAYNYTNTAPTVAIESPTNNASFLSRPNIVLLARAGDSNGWVTSVEFFAGSTSLAMVTNHPFRSGPFPARAASPPNTALPPIVRSPEQNFLMAVWTNVPPATYTLTAVATDNAGLQTTSAPVTITVTTKLPEPAVRIIAPMNGSSFPSNAPINIVAAAGEVGGAIATVEFLAQGKSLGVVTNDPSWSPWPGFSSGGTNIPWQPFSFLWTNAPTGSNTLTALATDNNGTTILSSPVTVDVRTNSFRQRHW